MTLFLRLAGHDVTDHGARCLDLELASDRPLAELAPAALDPLPFPVVPSFVPRAGRSVFSGEVFLAGGRAHLAVWWQGDRAWLEVDRTAIGIDLAVGLVEVVVPPALGSERWLEHVLLGPPLLLALAHRGVFGLHAGAVEVAGTVEVENYLVAFLGASEAGKSTLARSNGPAWRRFADDLLPVEIDREGVAQGLGGFPQLKLAPQDRRLCEERTLALAAVFVLDGRAEEPTARRLSPAEAATAWVAHTMIARLFSPRLLGDHLAWAAAGARAVPTWAVRFPWGLDRLEEVRAFLAELAGEHARLCYPPGR